MLIHRLTASFQAVGLCAALAQAWNGGTGGGGVITACVGAMLGWAAVRAESANHGAAILPEPGLAGNRGTPRLAIGLWAPWGFAASTDTLSRTADLAGGLGAWAPAACWFVAGLGTGWLAAPRRGLAPRRAVHRSLIAALFAAPTVVVVLEQGLAASWPLVLAWLGGVLALPPESTPAREGGLAPLAAALVFGWMAPLLLAKAAYAFGSAALLAFAAAPLLWAIPKTQVRDPRWAAALAALGLATALPIPTWASIALMVATVLGAAAAGTRPGPAWAFGLVAAALLPPPHPAAPDHGERWLSGRVPTRARGEPLTALVDGQGQERTPGGAWIVALPSLFGRNGGPLRLWGDFGPGALDLGRRLGDVWWWPSTPGLAGAVLAAPVHGLPLTEDPALSVRTGAPSGGPSPLVVDVPAPYRPGARSFWSGPAVRSIVEDPASTVVLRVDHAQTPAELLDSLLTGCGETHGCWLFVEPESREVAVLVRQRQEAPWSAAMLLDGARPDVIQWALATTGLRDPLELVDRLVAGPEELQFSSPSRDPWFRMWLPLPPAWPVPSVPRGWLLGHMALPDPSTGRDGAVRLDFTGLPEARRPALEARLRRAAAGRLPWVEMLWAAARGDLEQAATFAQRFVQSGGASSSTLATFVDPWLSRGRAAAASGDLATAERELVVAFAFAPGDSQIGHELAGVQRALGKLDAAATTWARVLAGHPTNLQAGLGLAAVRKDQGRLADAAEVLGTLEPVHPASYSLLVNLAHLETQLAQGSDDNVSRRLGRARILLQRATTLEPTRPQGHAAMAELLWKSGDTAGALTSIDRALSLGDDCQFRAWRGLLLFDSRRLPEAEGELQRALLACPTHVPALISLGGVQADLGRPAQAAETWRRALELEPGHAAATTNLQWLESSGLLNVDPRELGRP